MRRKSGHINFLPIKEKLDENNEALTWAFLALCAIAIMLLTSIEVTGGYGK